MGNNVKWFRKCGITIWLICICCFVFSVRAEAAYSPNGAVNYAKDHCASGHTSGKSNCPNSWMCAEFVSKCLQKGGMGNATKAGCRSLYTELKKYGTSYALTVDSKGYINVKSNQGKISVGDVIITHCNTHDLYLHAVLVSSIDSNGYVYNYAHNNNKMNQKLVASRWCSKQGGNENYSKITAYVIHFPHTTCVWDSGKITKKATCTTNGTRTYTCTVCKKTKTSEIAATGHKGGTATCTSKAKCSTCGASYGNYGNHQYSTDWTIDKAASCATAGSKSHHCKYCNTQKDVTSIPATGHSWDEGTVLRQATETTTGLKSYTCYNCGTTKTEILPTIEKDDDITLVKEITLSHINAKLSCGDTLQLTATVAPANADNKAVVWVSSAESIITVSSTGLVKAVSPGDAMIFCTAIDGSGVKDSCSITVLPNDYENEELEEGNMLTDPKSDADYEIIESQNGMGTVRYLGSKANAKTVKIPETITVYGVTYKVTSIGEGAFEDDRNVTRIIMGNNIIDIERNAFKGCSRLTSIVIGNNVTQIGDKAFYKCKNLTKITIPSRVNKIGKQAFYGCKKLSRITIKTMKLTGKRIGSRAFEGIYKKAKVKVPKSKLKIYQKILKEKGIGTKTKIMK